jgi:TonB family protein
VRNVEAWVLSYLLNSLWQVPLLFAAGWLAARGVRALGAAAEHRVWVAVLLLQAVLPAWSVAAYSIAVGPRMWSWLVWGRGPGSSDAHVSVVVGAGTGVGAVPLPASLLTGLALLYGAVCAYFAARFAWRWVHLRRLRQESTEMVLSGDAARCWTECSARFEGDGAAIARSPSLFAPVTMGFARKLILLPASMTEDVAETDLHAVLAHELAHIRRNDFLKNLVYELLAVPVSYHPIFRVTRERLIETREMVCDQMAAAASGRRTYARSLLRLASLLVTGAPARIPHAIGVFDANTFERRIMRLTEKRVEVRGVRRLATIAACAALGIGTCGSALALHLHVNGLSAMSASAQPSGPIHVSSNVMQGNRISGPVPVYPPDAKKKKVQGKVVIDATIDKEGKIAELHVVSGPPMLRQSSLDAVKQWVYKPFLVNGDPVEVETTINVIYSLEKNVIYSLEK